MRYFQLHLFIFLALFFPTYAARMPPNSTSSVRPLSRSAILTLNGFEKGEDGGGPSECDGNYHDDDTLIVALSTPWYNHGSRCFHSILIHGNGHSTHAKVVDECDVGGGCKKNIVDGSRAVWAALKVSTDDDDYGYMPVTWSDA